MASSAAGRVLPAGAILAILAAVCTALVAVTYQLTAPRIAANEQAYLEQRLQPVLGDIEYEGTLSESTIEIAPPHTLPGKGPVSIYRVFAGEEPVAALFIVTPRDGYAGPIRLLIGIASDGGITGVRALAHRETAGLGDQIDESKSDWILQFSGRSLSDSACRYLVHSERRRRIRPDDGRIDHVPLGDQGSKADVGILLGEPR